MVEQRPGRRDAAPWVLEGGRRLPGHDDNRRLAALRRGLLRHAGVRAIGADAPGEQVELALERATRALLPTGAAAGVLRRAGRAPRARAARPAARHPGARRPRRRRPRGGAHGDHRGHSSCGGRALHLRALPPTRPSRRPWVAGGLLLPQHRRRRGVDAARERGAPVGVLDLDLHYPNGTAAILAPMADVHLHSVHAFPVTNVPALTVRPRSDREHVVELAGSPSVEVYLDAVATSIDALAQSSLRAGRVARLRHRRGRPPRIVEPSARRSLRRSAACWRLVGCRCA